MNIIDFRFLLILLMTIVSNYELTPEQAFKLCELFKKFHNLPVYLKDGEIPVTFTQYLWCGETEQVLDAIDKRLFEGLAVHFYDCAASRLTKPSKGYDLFTGILNNSPRFYSI
ncbi:hypothetical protein [Gloeothece verrucosa]|uniref:Uncharacterized protein n=1 Tax=Gloeothece verrucosa (strain PCC 7822) TaxID=497965 RepID=E0UJ73_GLOV7|nr:hypothetical protein [Gloeothece verrucosa]ADN15776.1 hypothetical protein Cyan7822_3844 [Gloeothece verrucosa PCC 7822]